MGTTLSLSYQNGDPCFTGTIAASGWGAVYDLTYAPDDSTWNAATAGVTGFNYSFRGAAQPASVKVIYKDPSGVDFCRIIGPGDITVAFSDAHPSCASSGSSTVDTTRLVELILAFPVNAQSYAVDFCLQMTALD